MASAAVPLGGGGYPLTLTPILILLAVIAIFPLVAGYIVHLERKVLADMQVRLGPMRVGPHGLMQPIADALKLVLKEDIVPSRADKWIFLAAPVVSVFTALSTFSILPFADTIVAADVNVGLLIFAAMGAVGVLGIILGGWSSNSHYPLLGSLRSAAQLVSYEVALSLALLAPVMAAESLSMVKIVEAQRAAGLWFVFGNYGLMLLPFLVFLVAATAETNRIPFDLPEAEGELVGGFHTEYSGFRWALYMLAEYGNLFVVSSVATTLFLGGWLRPFPNVAWLAIPFDAVLPILLIAGAGVGSMWLARRISVPIPRIAMFAVGAALTLASGLFLVPTLRPALSGLFWFFLKVGALLYAFIWFRGTWPRFRYDQLMDIGWKRLIPLGLAALGLNAVAGLL